MEAERNALLFSVLNNSPRSWPAATEAALYSG